MSTTRGSLPTLIFWDRVWEAGTVWYLLSISFFGLVRWLELSLMSPKYGYTWERWFAYESFYGGLSLGLGALVHLSVFLTTSRTPQERGRSLALGLFMLLLAWYAFHARVGNHVSASAGNLYLSLSLNVALPFVAGHARIPGHGQVAIPTDLRPAWDHLCAAIRGMAFADMMSYPLFWYVSLHLSGKDRCSFEKDPFLWMVLTLAITLRVLSSGYSSFLVYRSTTLFPKRTDKKVD
jgi:hypothetical protein